MPPGRPGPRAYDAVVTPPDEQAAPGAPEHAAPASTDAEDDAPARVRQGDERPVGPVRKAPAKKASPGTKKASAGAKKASPRRKSAPPARSVDTAGEQSAPPSAERPRRRAPEPVHDVVVIGAGPAGAACGYWLADAGWDVVVVEKKEFPREKTCGDGLTPRAVRQLADMGLEDALSGSHRYSGLRAFGFGQSIEMSWPEHPNFPDYGYTITRHDLDGLVAARAAEAGATLWQGTEVTALVEDETAAPAALPTLAGVTVKAKSSARTRTVKARYVVVADGSNSRVGRMLGTSRQRDLPAGDGAARLLPVRSPRRPVHRVAPRHPRRRGKRGARLRLDLPHGRRPGQRRRRAALDRAALEGRQHDSPDGHLRRLRAGVVGSVPRDEPAGRRPAASSPWGCRSGPRAGGNVVVAGDAGGVINPFNGEGISYGYETGRLAAAALGQALTGGGRAVPRSTTTAASPPPTASYYKVARAFVHLISHPEAMRACVGLGMRSDLVMNQLLRIMANLMRPDAAGPAEVGYRALELVSRLLPDPDGLEDPAA